MGLLPFNSADAIAGISKVPGIKVSAEMQKLGEASANKVDLSDFSLALCMRLARLNREHVCGFHVVSGATPKLALRLSAELVKFKREL